MVILCGVIESIETKTTNGFLKKVLSLKVDTHQIVFVEFRQRMIVKYLEEFSPGDHVHIAVLFDGKTSQNSGIHYNNMVGKAIKKI